MNVYDLSRMFWDYAFENPDKVKPNHIAMYFFAIEHCNRLGWKDKFGFPTTMVMDAISIKSYNTYIKTLNDLVEWEFIEMIERSKNQYSANIIALSKNDKANNKALDKALIKHITKQVESTIQCTSESTVQSIDSIDKPIYQYTNLQSVVEETDSDLQKISDFKNFLKTQKPIQMDRLKMAHNFSDDQMNLKIDEFVEKKVSWSDDNWLSEGDLSKNFEFWLAKNPKLPFTGFTRWTKEDFFKDVQTVSNGQQISKETLQEFFDHYREPTPTGEMLFQSMNAWDTRSRLKKWLNNKKNYATRT